MTRAKAKDLQSAREGQVLPNGAIIVALRSNPETEQDYVLALTATGGGAAFASWRIDGNLDCRAGNYNSGFADALADFDERTGRNPEPWI